MCRSLALALSVLSLAIVTSSSLACGDKFLVPGKGGGPHQPPRALAILIYGSEQSHSVAASSRTNLEQMLRNVGHHVQACEDPDACKAAIGKRRYDVVIADAKDAHVLKGDLPKGKDTPGFVAVAMNMTRQQAAAARAEFGQVYDVTKSTVYLLAAVNRAAKASR